MQPSIDSLLVKTFGSAVQGVDASTIAVEVNIDKGINFSLVGEVLISVYVSQGKNNLPHLTGPFKWIKPSEHSH